MTPQVTTPQVTTRGAEVRLDGLVKRYSGRAVVEDVDIRIRTGEFLTLLGPSGSGKTTTLSMIAGFTEPSAGTVVIDGTDITTVPPHKRGLGMVFQNYSLFPHMTVRENVEFPLRQRGVAKGERKRRALEALELVELDARADAKPAQLSGGQQQRVALARALVFEPSLLLMDEPFGALDRALRERLQIELRRLHRELGVTVVFVTHDQEEALTMSDRIAVFNDGRIEQIGTPEELYEDPRALFVARFIGESNAIPGTVAGEMFRNEHGASQPAPGLPDGDAVVIVRPERLVLLGPGEQAEQELTGTVADVTYLGSERRIEIQTVVGPMIVRCGPSASTPRPGAELRVGWAREHGTVFSDPESLENRKQQWTTSLGLPA